VIDSKLRDIFDERGVDNFAKAMEMLLDYGGYTPVEAFANANHFYPLLSMGCDLFVVHQTNYRVKNDVRKVICYKRKDVPSLEHLVSTAVGEFMSGEITLLFDIYEEVFEVLGEIPDNRLLDYVIDQLDDGDNRRLRLEKCTNIDDSEDIAGDYQDNFAHQGEVLDDFMEGGVTEDEDEIYIGDNVEAYRENAFNYFQSLTDRQLDELVDRRHVLASNQRDVLADYIEYINDHGR
jgi:hypothetical protein